MLKDYLRRFEDDTLKLAKLIVVKLSVNADIINTALKTRYGGDIVNDANPYSWKYYKHLAGEYHETDTPMYIYSLDTSEEILFSKQNIQLHDATRKAYQDLDANYYRLVKKYADQETLIRGILFPVDIDKAIESEDGTILTYPSYLVESREYTLIQELEDWIKKYLVRWDVQAFITSDGYYAAAQQAVMYLNILQRLYNLRNKRIHTIEAHSFHIRAFLASHGLLDVYYDYLTEKQRLFLYRNIRYIENNTGKTPIFESLIDKILTERRIPLTEYTIKQLRSYDDEGYSDYHIRKNPLNKYYNSLEKDYYLLQEIPDKESTLTEGNKRYWEENLDKIIHTIRNSGNSTILTKDLESSMYDYSNAVPDPLPLVLLNEWIYSSYSELYQAVLTVKNPTKTELISFTSNKALIYYIYLACNHLGITLQHLPIIVAYKVNRKHDDNWSGVSDIASASSRLNKNEIAEMLYDSLPQPSLFYSIEQFYNYCYELFKSKLSQWLYRSNIGNAYIEGEVHAMIQKLYMTVNLDFKNHQTINPTGLSMNDWLFANNLPIDNFNRTDRETLMVSIFNTATGYVIDKTKILSQIQLMMISIMKQLSSYSVQYIRDINDVDIRIISKPDIKPADSIGLMNNTFMYTKMNNRVDTYGTFNMDIDFSLKNACNISKDASLHSTTIYYDISLDDKLYVDIHDTGMYRINNPQVWLSSGSLIQNLSVEQINSLRI